MDFGQFDERWMMLLLYWHYKMDKPFKQRYREHEKSMSLETYYCLQMLRLGGPVTMSELADRLKISKQQATKTIEKLYKYDFVRRLTDLKDRRVVRIEITDTAVAYIQQNIHQNMQLMEKWKAEIGEEDLLALQKAMETFLQILPKLK